MISKSLPILKSEIELFNSRDFWTEEDNIVEAINLHLRPHSEVYYSELCPIFTYEILKYESLNLFGLIQLRDGICFILDFFLKHPNPENLRTKLIVNSKLRFLIPEAWRKNVYFVKLASTNKAIGISELYFITGETISSNTLKQLEAYYSEGVQTVNLILTCTSPMSGLDRGSIGAKFANFACELKERFPNIKFNFLQMSEVCSRSVKGKLVDIDDGLLNWCSDSYLMHLMLSYGACLRTSVSPKNEDFFEVGPNYGFLFQNDKFDNVEMLVWEDVHTYNITFNNPNSINRVHGQLKDYLHPGIIEFSKNLLSKLAR